jgi:DNA-binding MarR family transcriptional regulator
MRADRGLELVGGGGGDGHLAAGAADVGFTVLLEIWQSAVEELVREVPPDQLRVLEIIDRAGSMTIGRLAHALGATTSATSRLCDRMEAAGLLTRGRGARGGPVTIFVTTSGRRAGAWIGHQRQAVLDHVLQSLTPDGRAGLARALSELAADRVPRAAPGISPLPTSVTSPASEPAPGQRSSH